MIQIGSRFTRLLVVKRSVRRDNREERFWLCKCECGTMIEDEMRDGKPRKFVNDRHQKNFRNNQSVNAAIASNTRNITQS